MLDSNAFFDELLTLPPDESQPSLEEISQIVREVRVELWGFDNRRFGSVSFEPDRLDSNDDSR